MSLDLATLCAPAHTAIVTSECQQGVIGTDSMLPELAAAGASIFAVLTPLLLAARAASVNVVHCLYARREDYLGSNLNARLFRSLRSLSPAQLIGSQAATLVPELGPAASDLVLTRTHGLNPMSGTDLDPVLRNLGTRTIVVTGVSVNVAVTNLVMEAVNLGYDVVIPRDAVAGVPADYADAVIDNTLSLLATLTTTADLIAAWQ